MHRNTWNCFPGDASLHHREAESLIRLVQPCLKHPVALIYVHGCFYKVDLHCWTRLKSFLKVADPQIHELTEIPYCHRWFEIKSLDHLNSISTGAYVERQYEQDSYEKPLTYIIALNALTNCNRYPVHVYRIMPITFPVAQSFLKLISRGHIIKFLPILTTLRPQLPRLLVFLNILACPLAWETAHTFQRFMDEILQDWDFCFTFLVDILVFSRSPKSTTNTSVPPSPNFKTMTSNWTHPSAFSVFLKCHSWDIKSHP